MKSKVLGMKSLIKTKLAEGLVNLTSEAIASNNLDSTWYQFHEDCVNKLESENSVIVPVKKKNQLLMLILLSVRKRLLLFV